MAIKGLTDRQSVTPRFTRLGKVKKGMLNQHGNPVDLEYLRFVGEGPDKGRLEQVWGTAYGIQPVRIALYLPYPTMEENWATWLEEWSGKQGLQHRCNGEHMVQWLDPQTLTYQRDYELKQQQPCPYASGEKQRTARKPGCTAVGRLAMILPPFLEAGYPGYITLEIGSLNDLANITASLLDAESKATAAQRRTGLQGIEFMLTRRPDEIGVRFPNKKGGYTKTKKIKWMLHLDPTREWMQAQLTTVSRLALGNTIQPRIIEVEARPALPAPLELPEASAEAPTVVSEPEKKTQQHDRPTTAEGIKAQLQTLAAALREVDAAGNETPTTNGQRGLYVGSMNKCFSDSAEAQRQQRLIVTSWLFETGNGSSKSLTLSEIRAWRREYIAASTETEKYPLHAYTAAEMQQCYAAALEDPEMQRLITVMEAAAEEQDVNL